MNKSNVLYIDLALENTVGHGLQYLTEFVSALETEMEVEVFCNRTASPDLAERFTANAILSAHPTRELSNNFVLNLIRRVLLEVTKSFFELRKISSASDSKKILFFQHIEYFNLLGILGCKRASNALIIVLRSDPLFGGKLASIVRVVFYSVLITLIRLKFRQNVTFVSDSPELSKVYEFFSPHLEVLTALPPAIELQKAQPEARSFDNDVNRAIKIAYLGRAVQEKGFNTLPSLVPMKSGARSKLTNQRKLHFIFDIFGSDDSTLASVQKLKEMTCEPNQLDSHITITLNDTPITSSDYNQKLREIDIALLLYDPGRYKRQTSGVLFDCILNGVLPIAYANTWLSGQIDTLGAGRIYEKIRENNELFDITELEVAQLKKARQILLSQPTIIDVIRAVTND